MQKILLLFAVLVCLAVVVVPGYAAAWPQTDQALTWRTLLYSGNVVIGHPFGDKTNDCTVFDHGYRCIVCSRQLFRRLDGSTQGNVEIHIFGNEQGGADERVAQHFEMPAVIPGLFQFTHVLEDNLYAVQFSMV